MEFNKYKKLKTVKQITHDIGDQVKIQQTHSKEKPLLGFENPKKEFSIKIEFYNLLMILVPSGKLTDMTL